MRYNLNICYKKVNHPISTGNISKFCEDFIDLLEDLYQDNNDFRIIIDKKFHIDYQTPGSQKKLPFGYLSDESLKTKDKEIVRDYIKNLYSSNNGVTGDIKISKNSNFFVFSGKTNVVLKNLEQIMKDIAKNIDDMEITFNDIKYFKNTKGEEMDSKKNNELNIDFYNKIIFGPTGTGKSRLAEEYAKKITNDKNKISRVTFHPEYGYSDFFGQYKPVVYETDNGNVKVSSPYNQGKSMNILPSYVTYSFNHGIFLECLIKSLSEKDESYVLLIDEINRGNCASIFGDLLQLLDRDETGNSKYDLSMSLEIKRYLVFLKNTVEQNNYEVIKGISNSNLKTSLDMLLNNDKIYIPKNLTIIGTMNTSDQSLYPMDAAFKRRWDMEYLEVDYTNKEIKIENSGKKWIDVLKDVNDNIIKELNSEDKTIGQWFLMPVNNVIKERDIKNKLLSYLYFDVYKHYDDVFNNYKYSKIIKLEIDEILNIITNKSNNT
jgi:hypothetical protein